MKTIGLILLLLTFFLNGCSYYCRSPVFQTAEVLEKKDASFEVNGITTQYGNEDDKEQVPTIDLAYKNGIIDKLEIGGRLRGFIFDLPMIILEGKYQFLKEEKYKPSLSLLTSFSLPVIAIDMGIIMSKHINEKNNLAIACRFGLNKEAKGDLFFPIMSDASPSSPVEYSFIFTEISGGMEIDLDEKNRLNFCISYQNVNSNVPTSSNNYREIPNKSKIFYYSIGFKHFINYKKIIEK